MIRRLALIAALAMLAALPASAGSMPAKTLTDVLRANDWLNGRPPKSLLGKVVLVDVFAVDCSNCRNVTPNLRTLHETLGEGLVVIGVHTPELPVEHQRAYLIAGMRDLGITWPVAVDNDQNLWQAYGIMDWPTELIFDKKGKLRKTVIGDGEDKLVNDTVHALLAES